jgi:hypothetical protein
MILALLPCYSLHRSSDRAVGVAKRSAPSFLNAFSAFIERDRVVPTESAQFRLGDVAGRLAATPPGGSVPIDSGLETASLG